MKTILLLHDESGSPKPRFQNVAGSKKTQRASEGTPGCNCDRWGHPQPRGLQSVRAQHKRGVNLISDALPFGRQLLWRTERS